MFGIGITEIIVILVIALIVIGPSKLPEFARSAGKGMRQFQDSFNSVKQDLNNEFSDVKDFSHDATIFGQPEEKSETPKNHSPNNKNTTTNNGVKQDLNKEFSDVKGFTHDETILGQPEEKTKTPKNYSPNNKNNNIKC